MREREPCVYILASGFNGTVNVGVTSNLIGRIIQHREGVFDSFTKRHGITRLVWFDMADTIGAEKRIKKWPRDWKKNLIERENPHWDDLAVELSLPPLP